MISLEKALGFENAYDMVWWAVHGALSEAKMWLEMSKSGHNEQVRNYAKQNAIKYYRQYKVYKELTREGF